MGSDLKFEHLSVEQGLSQSTVRCILQDRRGFLWIGTHDGLNRYDGRGFKVFRHDPGDTTSLSNNCIIAIVEYRQGYLWLATRTELSRFDPARPSAFVIMSTFPPLTAAALPITKSTHCVWTVPACYGSELMAAA
jgi:ligand-binding sensor domain-containing protein